MFCCGKDRTGNFCEDCGKCLTDAVVATLLQHLRTQTNSAKSKLRGFETMLKAQPNSSHYAKEVDKYHKTVAAREAWMKWVSERNTAPAKA